MFWIYEMKKNHFSGLAPATLIIGVCLAANLATLSVGLPSRAKATLIFEEGTQQQYVPALKQLREKIYEQITTGETVTIIKNLKPAVIDEVPYNVSRSFLLQTIWPDETAPVRALQNINPQHLQFNPHFHQYGPLFFYSAGAAIQIGAWIGMFPNPHQIEAYLANPEYAKRMWMAPRLISAFSMTLAAFIIFFLARTAYGPYWGIFACALIASSPVLLMESHYLKPYNQAALLNSVVLLFLFRTRETWRAKYLFFAAFLSIIGVGFLPTNATLISAIVVIAWTTRGRYHGQQFVFLKCMGILVISFIIFDPWWLLATKEAIYAFSGDPAAKPKAMFSLVNWLRSWLYYYPEGSNYILFMTAAAGIIIGVIRKNFLVIICAVPIILLTPMLALSAIPHYVSSVYPAIVLAAVYALRELHRFSHRISKTLAGLMLAYGLCQFAFYLRVLQQFDVVQLQAGQWINKNIPRGSTVGSPHMTPLLPPFHFFDYQLMPIGPTADCVATDLASTHPDYYVAHGSSAPDTQKTLGSFYKPIAAFQVHTPFDSFVKNYLFALLMEPITIYIAKDISLPSENEKSRTTTTIRPARI